MVMGLGYLPRYLITFGPFSGLWVFVQVEWFKTSNIRLKGIKHPIQVRPNTTDRLVFREVFLFKSYAIDWKEPKIIVDGGGNIGLTSIWFTHQFPDAKIYTIEPSDNNYRQLLKNIAPYTNVTAIHSALWHRDSWLHIWNKTDSDWAFVVEECAATQPGAFQAKSITSLMQEYNWPIIDLLKLDVEGAERELFLADYDFWITRTRCIVVELHDWLKPDCSKTVFAAISKYNFKTVLVNGMLQFINQDLIR
jgi:FkbM family methyltransferase